MRVHAGTFLSAVVLAATTACAGGSVSAPVVTSPTPATPQSSAGPDPRLSLRAGWMDAGIAASNMNLVATRPRPAGFFDANALGNILLANSDMAFRGNDLFMGSFHGFQIWDITDPRNPRHRTSVVCPGGQGDVSVYGNLLFMSVEMPNGRLDCGPQGSFTDSVSRDRFLGVRIFDISNLDQPRQVAAVQTCRGSHTHTLVTDPRDNANVYIYVSGTSTVRSATELAGCSGGAPEQDPNTAYFRIEVIQVPVAAPQNARVVNAPRIFADAQTGAISGLWRGGAHGAGTQETATTDQCHDITAYPEIGLAAGACSGNGILLDISNPASPRRIEEVMDPNFAYWHSATFNNEGSKVIYTDEWGGGTQARCRESDPRNWGANAIFELNNGELTQRGYYKLPVAQKAQENCVAHNGTLVPVPGRDIMVQAWYQGGTSVFDFTDPSNPYEIAYFDRGPMDARTLHLGGHWSSYWYNGYIFGSEIGRGLDVMELQPSEHLSQSEIDAAKLVRLEQFNPQTQPRLSWPAHISVARAYLDQVIRARDVAGDRTARVASELEQAARLTDAGARSAALTRVSAMVSQLEAETRARAGAPATAKRLGLLAQTLRDMAAAR